MEKIDLQPYLKLAEQLPAKTQQRYTKDELLTDQFLLANDQRMQIFFAPHNLYVETKAQLVVVGICPGWTQTEQAFHTYRNNLGSDMEERLKICKKESRFAGGMRKNLVEMLDQLHLNRYFDLDSSAELFDGAANLLHTTSLIKFPVFKAGKNYPGYGPKIMKNQMLTEFLQNYFVTEMAEFKHPILVLPLGKAVEEVLLTLQAQGQLCQATVVCGFPHPSGVNGHRKAQFTQNFVSLKNQLQNFFYQNQT